jgi:hypothetical protein
MGYQKIKQAEGRACQSYKLSKMQALDHLVCKSNGVPMSSKRSSTEARGATSMAWSLRN